MNLVTLTNLRIVKIVEVIAVMEKAKEDNAILRPREPQVMLMVQNKAVQSYPNDLEIEVLTEFHSIDQKVMCESSEHEPSVSFFISYKTQLDKA